MADPAEIAAEMERTLLKHLQSFVGTTNTELVQLHMRHALERVLYETLQEHIDPFDFASWLKFDTYTEDNDPTRIIFEPRNIFTALVFAGVRNPPRETVGCDRFETEDYIWEMKNGTVVVSPKERITLTFTIPKEDGDGQEDDGD